MISFKTNLIESLAIFLIKSLFFTDLSFCFLRFIIISS
nr:MAG TPA: hypothetical protein [Crassvirales sp.]